MQSMISSEALTKRFGHFTAVDQVSFAGARLKEPPEPSPGLSAAMPWVGTPQITPRPERAREALENSNRTFLDVGHSTNNFFRPCRAIDLIAIQSQGIALMRSALGCILMAFQATVTAPDNHTTF
jgi:hypothetical protein